MSAHHRDAAEAAHFAEILNSFRDYEAWVALELRRRERHLRALPRRYAERLPSGGADKNAALWNAVTLNQSLLDAICDAQLESGFGGAFSPGTAATQSRLGHASELPTSSAAHHSKCRSTLHQLVRDWSAEGVAERETSYGVLMKLIAEALPVTPANRNAQRVLIPGCGLGRLPFELALAGYAAQGNEFSLQMLFASHYVLNCLPSDNDATAPPPSVQLCPWIHDPSNHLRPDDMLRCISVPDVHPASLLERNPDADFSMAAGEFTEVYGTPEHKGAWDAVVTCFFIDTAPVAFEYIDVIAHCLRPGGVWLNCGPLQYHWASPPAGDEYGDEEGVEGGGCNDSSSGGGGVARPASAHSPGHPAAAAAAAAASTTREVAGGTSSVIVDEAAAAGEHLSHRDHGHAASARRPVAGNGSSSSDDAAEHSHSHSGGQCSSSSHSGSHPAAAAAAAAPASAARQGAPPRIDERYLRSVELSYAELRHVIIASGFSMSRESTGRTTYAANRLSLSKTLFTTVNFVATKADVNDSSSKSSSSGSNRAGGAVVSISSTSSSSGVRPRG